MYTHITLEKSYRLLGTEEMGRSLPMPMPTLWRNSLCHTPLKGILNESLLLLIFQNSVDQTLTITLT